jgi:hypothetical protein
MCQMTAAKCVQPYFEDEHGQPDTLPDQFVDPDTGYCQPFPHWKLTLSKQVAWVPTYLQHFQSTIPNDNSNRSLKLWNLSDEQIIILLSDGPFKSAQTAWCNLKKTDKEVELMRAHVRQYQCVERVSPGLVT